MKFIDSAKVLIASGNGGKGAVSWCREKFREFGGPDGGDGGRGGHIIIQGDSGLYTLYDFKLNPHLIAKNGLAGAGRNKTGRNGTDLLIKVPLGTVIYNTETDLEITEIIDCEPKILLKGGQGGKGNSFFKNSIRQRPKFSQPGLPGIRLKVRLELKSLADIGLVGLPNAGKSSLLACISKARPKIAPYPFTTMSPKLGVVEPEENIAEHFTVADIPGIIEGASQGKGLGNQFLKHIQRTHLLAFVLDISPNVEHKPLDTYQLLQAELLDYSKELANKPKIIILTKYDLVNTLTDIKKIEADFEKIDIKVCITSAKTGYGIKKIKSLLYEQLQRNPAI